MSPSPSTAGLPRILEILAIAVCLLGCLSGLAAFAVLLAGPAQADNFLLILALASFVVAVLGFFILRALARILSGVLYVEERLGRGDGAPPPSSASRAHYFDQIPPL